MYAATMMRPDIADAAGMLCHYMATPTKEHWQPAERILRYLAGIKKLGIVYSKDGGSAKAYGDADYASDVDTRRSQSGSIVIKTGVALLWGSKLQTTVATSTCEADCATAAVAVKNAL
jgi:hypothetical protein